MNYFWCLWLFLRLVWREWELGYRIAWKTAWGVAAGIWLDRSRKEWERRRHAAN